MIFNNILKKDVKNLIKNNKKSNRFNLSKSIV